MGKRVSGTAEDPVERVMSVATNGEKKQEIST